MIEKIILLENISLIDFLGVENKIIDTLAAAFPKSKIISRGNEVLIKGSTEEIIQIDDILTSLVDHYHRYGKVTEENVQNYLGREQEMLVTDIADSNDDIIIYGTRGNPIKPKSVNQQKLVQLVKENDLVFFIGSGGGLAFAAAAFRM